MRLYATRPHEVLARVGGTIDAAGLELVLARVTATFGPGVQVVVDVNAIYALTPSGVAALAELDRRAKTRCTRLYVVGVCGPRPCATFSVLGRDSTAMTDRF